MGVENWLECTDLDTTVWKKMLRKQTQTMFKKNHNKMDNNELSNLIERMSKDKNHKMPILRLLFYLPCLLKHTQYILNLTIIIKCVWIFQFTSYKYLALEQ